MAKEAINQQCRKWLITINNPKKLGFTIARILEILGSLNPLYACYAEEIGEKGTRHIHIFIYRKSPIRFNTLKAKFPGAHLDPCNGTIRENRDYVAKEGKWKDTNKAETVIEGSFKEIGELPEEKMSSDEKYQELIRLIKAKTPLDTIIEIIPSYALRINQIKVLREQILRTEYSNKIRDVKVIYIDGITGAGKTRMVYNKHGYENVYRVTKYSDYNGVKFDEYDFHDVLVFDEFQHQIPITEMLMYLDIYPIELPARYTNHTASYETVYILSNLPFCEQYKELKLQDRETYNAWLRRIQIIYRMDEDGKLHDVTKETKKYVQH